MPKISRRRAAGAFAVVGLLAGAAHVLATEAGDLRLWREVAPLAVLLGALLGAAFRPVGWRQGAALALIAIPAFALAYALAETAMTAGRGELSGVGDGAAAAAHWIGVVMRQAAIGGVAAALAGAAGGAWLGRSGRGSD